MRYQIVGQTVPAVELVLNKGEQFFTQSGGMFYQSEGIDMQTNARGGIGASLGRMFTGESIFMSTYTAQVDNATIAFSSTVPGCVLPINLAQTTGGIIMQKGAFLCAQNSVNLKVEFTKKFSAGLFGGEGFILQRAEGNGMLFMEIDGDQVVKTLQQGEVIKISTGNLVAFEPTVKYEIESIKGLKNIFLGGEGLFLTKLTGPGKVILQTQNFPDFAGRIRPYLATVN